MTSSEIRNKFLEFFEQRGHTIVPSSPVVPYDDPTLLFANAGMNQFKDVFLNTGKRSYARAADTQKCIRVSGKHNDLEEVGRDTYHHTFFEMLGNWSFGDYYKKEAIEWAWELLTKVWQLPKERLWATVYKDDQEAEQLWKTLTDIDPNHVLCFGEKDNFWEMGETGPCGPCSEIHIDRTANGSATAEMVNAGIPEVMEIWNLVFIQYNRDETGKLSPLQSKHVDTGMGFERICAVLQNKNSNYDTDVFTPIIQAISKLTGKPYNGKLAHIDKNQLEIDTSMRVIADHVRTLTFAIGDGALPSNEGRGYVLRRILRRAARFGRNLGMHEPFIYQLVPTLVETMSYIFPEIKSNAEHIQKIIKGEEESFNTTLDNGLKIFEELITEPQTSTSKIISGDDAFKLYDTFGFPLDLTELIADERGMKVDVGAFNKLMEKQKERSRITGKDTAYTGLKFSAESVKAAVTEFIGYSAFETNAKVLDLVDGYVVLDKTPFYAESGGQVGDIGLLIGKNKTIRVSNTQRDGDIIGHKVDEEAGYLFEQQIHAKIDIPRRLSIQRNHSATHLLHNALRRILGTHVKQAGSLVAPDYFRFDFSHFAKVTDEELSKIETLVNDKIRENIQRTPGLNKIPFEDAKKLGALMFFGDKYGDHVNVVKFGDFSTEFCGGTHVNNTGEIGYFKIRSESSVASGVRRIEGVTHDYALELLKIQDRSFFERLDYAFAQFDEAVQLKSELAKASGGKSGLANDSLNGYEQRLTDLKQITSIPKEASHELTACFDQVKSRNQMLEELVLQIGDAKKSIEKELGRFRLQSLSGSMDDLIASAQTADGVKVVASQVTASSMDELKALGDTLRSKLGSGIGLLATVLEDKVQLVCVVTDDLVQAKKAEAGKIVGAVAKLLGGGGGGRPHMATAGGKDVAKLDEAIARTKSIVESLLRK